MALTFCVLPDTLLTSNLAPGLKDRCLIELNYGVTHIGPHGQSIVAVHSCFRV